MAVVGYIDGYVDGTDEYGFADTQARTDISAIKDGTSIDSFGDVETALDGKVTKLVAGGVLGTDGNPINVETPLTLSNGEMGLMFGNIEEGVQTSPPTAGDVYSALAPKANTSDVNSKFTATVDLLKDTTGWLGKNELPNKLVSGSNNHVNYSVKEDKTVEIYTDVGGSTAQTTMLLVTAADNYKPKAGQKILSVSEEATAIQIVVAGYNGTTWVKNLANTSTHTPLNIDYDGYDRIGAYLLVNANNEIDHKIAYPMITTPEKYALSPSYEPYHESVELSKFNRSEANILAAKNLFPIDLNTLKAKNTTGIWADNVYTLNKAEFTCTVENGFVTKITVNSDGAITGNTNFILFDGNNSVDLVKKLKGKELTLNGCPSGGSSTTYRILFSTWSSVENKYDNGEGCTVDVPNNVAGMRFDIIMYSGYTANNKEFYPMLRLATDPDPTYAPPAMTNRELTEMLGNSGTYDLYMIANALTPANGAQPEFFIPWNNPELKTPTFSFTIRIRNNSAWETLEQSGAVNVQKVCKNGFLVNAVLTNALTSNSQFTFRIDGTITFS